MVHDSCTHNPLCCSVETVKSRDAAVTSIVLLAVTSIVLLHHNGEGLIDVVINSSLSG